MSQLSRYVRAKTLLPLGLLFLFGLFATQRERILPSKIGEISRTLLEESNEGAGDLSVSGTRECISWRPISGYGSNLPIPHLPKQDNRNSKLEIATESDLHRKNSFKQIWDFNAWGKEVKSGPGSLLQNTINMRRVLSSVIERIKLVLNKKTITFLDSSCGDMTWMPSFLKNRTDVVFTGYDIVPDNVDNHKKKFKGKPWKFEVHDIVSDPIPDKDIILSRHTLQHLLTGDVQRILANFLSSNSSFLLATNFAQFKTNIELDDDKQYRFRPVNLLLSPYFLPPPVCTSLDIPSEKLDISLWDLRLIREQQSEREKQSERDIQSDLVTV